MFSVQSEEDLYKKKKTVGHSPKKLVGINGLNLNFVDLTTHYFTKQFGCVHTFNLIKFTQIRLNESHLDKLFDENLNAWYINANLNF